MEEDATKIAELKKEIAPLELIVQKQQHNFSQLLQLQNLKSKLKLVTSDQHQGFQLVGDNIDFTINPRQFTTMKGRQSLHYFNFMAIKNRISGNDKDDSKPIGDMKDCPLTTFLPSHEDNVQLRLDWAILLGRIITRFFPEFERFKRYIPDVIKHEYSDITKLKTEVVGLGVIMESENTDQGIVNIMDYMKQYVPQGNTHHSIRIISAGDQLTCERESNAQEHRRDCPPEERWASMLPEIADFHTMGNFYEWIWKQLYTSDSRGCRDVGTLYASKVILNAKDVTERPLNSFYACEELIDKYLKALTLTAALQFFGMDNIKSKPTKNTHNIEEQTEEEYINDSLQNMVKEFAIQHEPDALTIQEADKCPECRRPYKTRKGLRKHIIDKHPDSEHVEDVQQSKATIRDYCCTAMGMLLLAQDFAYARRCGDGARLMRIYRFFTLHFKAGGKNKYAYHCLRLQAQINCLLSEKMSHLLTWNRFVNNKGGPTSNVEVDRENEHRNKVIKQETRGFHGKISDKSIKRVGEAAQSLDEIHTQADKAAGMKRSSGKHNKTDTSEDVLSLTDCLHKERIFAEDQDRRLHALPDFKKDPFSHLDLSALHEWMKKTLSKIANRKIFQE